MDYKKENRAKFVRMCADISKKDIDAMILEMEIEYTKANTNKESNTLAKYCIVSTAIRDFIHGN